MGEDNLGKARPLKAMIQKIAEMHGIHLGNFGIKINDDDTQEVFFTYMINSDKFRKNEDQEEVNEIFDALTSDLQPTVSTRFDMYEEFLNDDD